MRFASQYAWPIVDVQVNAGILQQSLTWSREIEPSRSSTRCLPSSSSSSSSSKADRGAPPRIPPNAALPPAKENGVDATAVPKTLAVAGAPNAAKSVTTFRGGDPGATAFGEDGVFTGDERTGDDPYEDAYELRLKD